MRPVHLALTALLSIAPALPAATAAASEAERAAASPERPSEPAGIGEATLLLDTVVMWLASNFDLPASFDHPRLVRASPERLTALRYGPQAEVAPGSVVAVYRDATGTMHLAETWDGRTPADLSVLVHEMVHHLQNRGGMRFACPGEREEVAYRAQARWLALFGSDLAREFEIDPATLMLRTKCGY